MFFEAEFVRVHLNECITDSVGVEGRVDGKKDKGHKQKIV